MAAILARRYAETVDVRRADQAPGRFVWRGRHYTVRAVLAHWIRTGAWWQQPGPVPGEVDDDEREFWRVEATAGHSGIPVVVDLCLAWATGLWTVTAVAD